MLGTSPSFQALGEIFLKEDSPWPKFPSVWSLALAELKRTDHDASPGVFPPNPSLSCRVFLFHGFSWVKERKGSKRGDCGIGEEGMGSVA